MKIFLSISYIDIIVMVNYFNILVSRTPWTIRKGKDMTPKDKPTRSVGVQYTPGGA